MPDPLIPTPPDPAVKGILDPLPVDTSLKASAWDAYHGATDQADFQQRFSGLALPNESKAALWDLKFGQAPKAPTTPAGGWRTNHPWLASGVDTMKTLGGYGLSLGKDLVEQSPELAGAWAGATAIAPTAATIGAAFPPAAPVSVPLTEAAGAFGGAYLARGAKYGVQKLAEGNQMGIPPPPSSTDEAVKGMRGAGTSAAVGYGFTGAFKAGKQVFGSGTLAQKWAKAVADSLGNVAKTGETAGKRMVGSITQQELEKKAPLNRAYNDILTHADEAEAFDEIIGHPENVLDGGSPIDAMTTRQLHEGQSKLLETARATEPGADRMRLQDEAARMKDRIAERLNGYGQDLGEAYQHTTALWHSMADTQLNNFVKALKADPSNAVDVFFRRAYPEVEKVVQGTGATAGVVARRGMDKNELIDLAQQAMPRQAWNDVKASVLDRAIKMASQGTELRGARLVNTLKQIGEDTADSLFGPDVSSALQSVAQTLEKIQGSTKFELAERFGMIGAAREVIQGKMSRAFESVGVPTLMRKMSSAPDAYKLYRTIIKEMPQLATSTTGQKFLSLLVQMAGIGDTPIPPPPNAPQAIPAPPR